MLMGILRVIVKVMARQEAVFLVNPPLFFVFQLVDWYFKC